MKKVLIKNGTIVTATDEFKGDLLLADGEIAAIGGAIDASSADEVYDAEGKYVMPGGVDQHTHFDFSFGDTTCGWMGRLSCSCCVRNDNDHRLCKPEGRLFSEGFHR